MIIDPNWKKILTRAWSVRLLVLAGLLSGAEVALPFLGDFVAPGLLAVLSFLATAGAFVARILVQRNMEHGT